MRRRCGAEPVAVVVRLEVDAQPERFQLSPGLASLLGLELESRHRVIEVPHLFGFGLASCLAGPCRLP